MKVDVSMSNDKDQFSVSSWWATGPEYVVDALRKQLEAASAIWPELAQFKIDKSRPRSQSKAERGTKGGEARAASLSPERRSEIASEAAKVRWGTTDTGSVT